MHYGRMRMDALRQCIEACPIAYLSVGPMEAHGPHCPVGLDALKAHTLCVRSASASTPHRGQSTRRSPYNNTSGILQIGTKSNERLGNRS